MRRFAARICPKQDANALPECHAKRKGPLLMTIKEKPDVSNVDEHADFEKFRDQNKEFIRAENEDDDGYDPYSDRKEHTPLFERDPWA